MPKRILQVGAGARGQMWADIIDRYEGSQLVGLVDLNPEALESTQARFPHLDLVVGTDLETAIDQSRPDVLVLVTPPETHREQVAIGCQRGIPLLVEKPLSVDLSEAVEIARMADEARVPISLCLNFRYLEVTQGLRRLIREEAKGEPNFAEFVYVRNRDGKTPGMNRYPLYMEHPMLLEQSIHHLDLIRYAYDREVQWVMADTWNPPWSMYDYDSNVSALMELEGGMRVNYLGTWTSGWDDMQFQWRTDCSDGVIIQKKLFADLRYADTKTTDPNPERELGGGGGGGELMPVPDVEPDVPFLDDTEALMAAFLRALDDPDYPRPCTAWDHLKSLAVVFACIRSVEEGRRVYLREIYEDYDIPEVEPTLG